MLCQTLLRMCSVGVIWYRDCGEACTVKRVVILWGTKLWQEKTLAKKSDDKIESFN